MSGPGVVVLLLPSRILNTLSADPGAETLSQKQLWACPGKTERSHFGIN